MHGFRLTKSKVGGTENPVEIVSSTYYPIDTPKWSPDGNWITCETANGLELISTDGKNRKVLFKEIPVLSGWSKDGSRVFTIINREKRMLMVALDVNTGNEKMIADLGYVSIGVQFQGFSLAPDGKSFATSVSRARADIWILEGFSQTRDPWGWFFSR